MGDVAGGVIPKYCFDCGRRVNPKQDTCWYCGATTRRVVRQPQRCPFCKETVIAGAVKCKHCGEFLDGREKQSAAQIVFVVDGRLLHLDHDLKLMPGQPVPAQIARILEPRTVQAIEKNQPSLIQQRGVRALPLSAPENEPHVIDIGDDEDTSTAMPVVRPKHDKQVGRPGETLPARRNNNPNNLPERSSGNAVGRFFGSAGNWLMKRPQPPATPGNGIHDADMHDRYRVCEQCGTEIFTSDNYCYECSFQYHKTQADAIREVKIKKQTSAKIPYTLSILLIGALAGARQQLIDVPAFFWRDELLALLAGFFCLRGFFKNNSALNQIMAVVLILAIIAAYLM